ncbi:response regulator transcription factor [Streptomyces sp. TR06-5]|uniref:response regulator transcription factor n=1 Tax=unclassified Streptomyces TaxID=2593676 RepID=UPI0039A3A436
MTIRIIVADDRRLIAETLSGALAQVRGFEVVETLDDSRQIIPAVRRTKPSVAVLGVCEPAGNEIRLADELRVAVPGCGVAVITSRPSREVMRRAAGGAFSVIPSHARLNHLIHAIRGIVAGCHTIDPSLLRARRTGRPLSEREREVLRLTADGAPIKEIAAELYLSPGTVRNVTSSAIKKLEGRNRFDAARIAGGRGLL